MVTGCTKCNEKVVKMAAYYEITNALIDMVQLYTDYPVFAGANPTLESIAVAGFASTATTFKDLDTADVYNVTINGKSGDFEKMLEALSNIHKALTVRKDFPQGDTWQIYAITTVSSPRQVGIEEADRTKFIFGSSVNVKFYKKGMKGDL